MSQHEVIGSLTACASIVSFLRSPISTRPSSFYVRVLGMTDSVFADGRHAVTFGASKINLQLAGQEFEPKARR